MPIFVIANKAILNLESSGAVAQTHLKSPQIVTECAPDTPKMLHCPLQPGSYVHIGCSYGVTVPGQAAMGATRPCGAGGVSAPSTPLPSGLQE